MSGVDRARRRWPVAVLACLVLAVGAARGDDVRTLAVADARVADVRDAVIEAIESAGLVVSATIPFNQMLERTGQALAYTNPYVAAETVQFCSARLAWQLVTEDPGQLALCPMSISIYATTAEPTVVRLAYRSPGATTPGRQRGEQLLRDLVARAAVLAGWRWRDTTR
jgi:uncharacterized protein (DUF302 family)